VVSPEELLRTVNKDQSFTQMTASWHLCLCCLCLTGLSSLRWRFSVLNLKVVVSLGFTFAAADAVAPRVPVDGVALWPVAPTS
jgi:hypothetical protein